MGLEAFNAEMDGRMGSAGETSPHQKIAVTRNKLSSKTTPFEAINSKTFYYDSVIIGGVVDWGTRMFLVGWWLTGGLFGWLIRTFYLIWSFEHSSRASETEQSQQFTRTASGYETAARILLLITAFVLTRESGKVRNADAEPTTPDFSSQPNEQSTVRRRGRAAAMLLLTIVFAIVTVFAIATDQAALPQAILAVKSYFVGVRFQAFFIGILSGFVLKQYRVQLARFTRRLGDAVIGDKDNTAWALQAALAIGLIAIAIFAVRPDFLFYLRSFKLGTVEATFADQGPLPLRDARLNLRDFREKVAVEQYKKFREEFISPTSERGIARRFLGSHVEHSALQDETGEIAVLLFEQYIDPVLSSVLCLAKVHALPVAIHDPDLSAYSSAWQDFLLKLHNDTFEMTADQFKSFLTSLRGRSAPFVARAQELNPSCKYWKIGIPAPQVPDKEAADQMLTRYTKAVDLLKKREYDKPAIRSLVIFEPYLTGASSDLIALISGEREKTDFLLNMLEGFPLFDDLVTPGMINLYYQVTDSWLNSVGPLPLDLIRDQIEYATGGADIMMARSEQRLTKLERTASVKGTAKAPEDDPDKIRKIYEIFLRNSFATLTAEVDIYVQRVLAGETVPEGHRQSWIKATSRLLAIVQTRSGTPAIDFEGVPRRELSSFEKERVRAATIDPDFMLQADLAIALSAILLNDANRATAQTCNAALFYINDAKVRVQPTIKENELEKAQEYRLQQLIGAVANRVGEACSWTDQKAR